MTQLIKSSNITNISLDMLSEKDKPHSSESLIGKQPVIKRKRNRREIEENSDEDNEEIQPRKARRPVGSKNRIYEKVPRELSDRSVLITPKRYDAHCFLITSAMDYTEATKSEDSRYWMAPMEEEYESLLHNETWTMTELSQGRTPIQCKWVFYYKRASKMYYSKVQS